MKKVIIIGDIRNAQTIVSRIEKEITHQKVEVVTIMKCDYGGTIKSILIPKVKFEQQPTFDPPKSKYHK